VSATPNGTRARGPYAEAALVYYRAGWAPIPVRGKAHPVAGYTGNDGAVPSFADISAWSQNGYGAWNIGVRLPDHVIGIDQDHYDGKAGAATIADREARWGALPPTPCSTSRTDGSRIRFYRVPEGLAWPGDLGQGSGVEIIRRAHRYAVVWPSVHPVTGATVLWFDAAGEEVDGPPLLGTLAALPVGWVAGMTGGEASSPPVGEKGTAADPFADPGGWRHEGPIPHGSRHTAIVAYAGSLRRRGLRLDEAETLILRRLADCAQPPEAPTPVTRDEALGKVRDVFARYSAGEVPGEAGDDIGSTLADEIAHDPALGQLVRDLQRRARAGQIVAEIEARTHPRPAPDCGTLAELLARPDTARYRVEGLLPAGGRMTATAQRKVGKTTLVGNLTRSLLTGEDFLGRYPVAPLTGRVVVLNYEVTGAQFARWMADIGVPPDRCYVINLRGRRNLLADADGRAELVAQIRAQDGEVLIVDPFGRAYTGKSQNDAAEVTPWLVRLDEVAEAAGIAEVILTAHAGWDGERTRGSTALEDWPDVIVTMTRDPDTDERFIKAEGRDVDLAEDRLTYDPATRTLRLSGDGSRRQVRHDSHLDGLARLVRTIVTAQPGINTAAIARSLKDAGAHLQKGDESKASALAADLGWVRRDPGPRGSWLHYPVHGPSPTPTTPD
jgi:hypothetical protein